MHYVYVQYHIILNIIENMPITYLQKAVNYSIKTDILS